jgi:HAD superfamily hydrolase (TIGR01549 family)
MQHLEAIFFDLDDTLVDDQASFTIATARVCADLRSGLDEALLTRTYVEVSNDYWRTRAYAYGDLYDVRLQLWQRALALCGCHDAALAETARNLYTQYRTEICEVYEGTVAVLEALAGAYRIGVVTNGHGDTQRNRLRLAGLDRYLDVVVAATDIDAGKPDPAIFAHALERLTLQPDEVWHVGDNLHSDVAGALNAGLGAAVWLNHRAEQRQPDHPAPHHEIASLAELPGLLP